MKKITLLVSILLLTFNWAFGDLNKDQCQKQGDKFIFAGGECIQYAVSKGDIENKINIIVHGTWKKGTNTLGRYAPFSETLSMNTDITSIAVALPGYSKSSLNKLSDLSHGGKTVYTKEYINFMASLVNALKEKFQAKEVNYIGHSAGASLGINMIALHPGIVNSLTAAGGKYNLDKFKENEKKELITIDNNIDKIGKTKILVVYGTKDKISKPQVSIDFYEKAKKHGVNIQLVKAEGAPHLDLDMTDACVEAFTEMVEEE